MESCGGSEGHGEGEAGRGGAEIVAVVEEERGRRHGGHESRIHSSEKGVPMAVCGEETRGFDGFIVCWQRGG